MFSDQRIKVQIDILSLVDGKRAKVVWHYVALAVLDFAANVPRELVSNVRTSNGRLATLDGTSVMIKLCLRTSKTGW